MDEDAVEVGGHLFGTTFFNFLLDMMSIFIFVIWFWILIRVLTDLFRRKDISGFGKVLWIVLVVILPYIGVFIYLLTQGWGLQERDFKQAETTREELRKMVGFSVADEIRKLEQLKADGVVSDDEYRKLRAKLI